MNNKNELLKTCSGAVKPFPGEMELKIIDVKIDEILSKIRNLETIFNDRFPSGRPGHAD